MHLQLNFDQHRPRKKRKPSIVRKRHWTREEYAAYFDRKTMGRSNKDSGAGFPVKRWGSSEETRRAASDLAVAAKCAELGIVPSDEVWLLMCKAGVDGWDWGGER